MNESNTLEKTRDKPESIFNELFSNTILETWENPIRRRTATINENKESENGEIVRVEIVEEMVSINARESEVKAKMIELRESKKTDITNIEIV